MLSLEMIGRFSDVPGTQHIPFPLSPFYPDRGDFIAIVGRFSDIGLTRKVKSAMRASGPLPVRSLTGPRWIPGVDFSDHYPYWDQGFPAVMITDTAFNRNRDYHTEGDTPDKLDYRRMAQVIQGVEGTIRVLAQ
jgi:Zn-dependent M28 family amino/carboxypeptidase